ncbi:MAG: ATP-dependent Clp protease proteolytic subunit [Spirochaetia bacterium]|nr:ATP-dependent Clp protease proteolytic subunit [Spirochaetia bacterium]
MNPLQTRIEKKLLEQRKLYLWGGVDDESAQYLVERLLYLDAVESGKDITLYINSPGGVITSGMAVMDTMNMIKSDVSTVCMGLAASMGALLLCAGAKGKRYAWPHSRIMIHQPLISGQIIAPAVDIKIQADEIRKIREELNRIISVATGKPLEQIENDTDRDYYMNAKEAVEYGIVDKMVESL